MEEHAQTPSSLNSAAIYLFMLVAHHTSHNTHITSGLNRSHNPYKTVVSNLIFCLIGIYLYFVEITPWILEKLPVAQPFNNFTFYGT
jgi:hypothetical protein